MDIERLVEEVERAIFRDWKSRPTTDIARSAILATLRGVREADRATVREGASCIFASVSEDVTSDERESDASASYTAMIDHLIKTVEG